jgi:DNA-binding transcriptional LysR family regulator
MMQRTTTPPAAGPPLPADPPGWHLPSRLRLRQLRLLVALDDHRKLHRAASALAMTQPAATRLLADLEGALELRLFERTARGLVPNLYGQSMIRHARIMIATLDHAREELVALAKGALGKVALGVLLVAAPELVPRAIVEFKRQHPRITVLVRDDSAASLAAALRRGELDLVVGRLESLEESRGLSFEPYYSEPMRLMARPGHPLARRARLQLASLRDESWVLPTPDAAYRDRLDAAFRRAGVELPANIVESRSVATNLALLRDSDRIGVVPEGLARQFEALRALRSLPIKLPAASGPVGAITVIGRALPPGTEDLLHALRETARRIRGGA